LLLLLLLLELLGRQLRRRNATSCQQQDSPHGVAT